MDLFISDNSEKTMPMQMHVVTVVDADAWRKFKVVTTWL